MKWAGVLEQQVAKLAWSQRGLTDDQIQDAKKCFTSSCLFPNKVCKHKHNIEKTRQEMALSESGCSRKSREDQWRTSSQGPPAAPLRELVVLPVLLCSPPGLPRLL